VDKGQLCLKQAQRLALGTVVQPIMTHLTKSRWEHMLEKPAYELHWFESRGVALAGFAVTIVEDDEPVIMMKDGGIGERHAVDIASQIS
jgi:hypothetical protein